MAGNWMPAFDARLFLFFDYRLKVSEDGILQHTCEVAGRPGFVSFRADAVGMEELAPRLASKQGTHLKSASCCGIASQSGLASKRNLSPHGYIAPIPKRVLFWIKKADSGRVPDEPACLPADPRRFRQFIVRHRRPGPKVIFDHAKSKLPTWGAITGRPNIVKSCHETEAAARHFNFKLKSL